MAGTGVRKYALIINGAIKDYDFEAQEKSLKFFESKGFETYVASHKRPTAPHDHYTTVTPSNIKSLIGKLRRKTDKNDELVIYTIGHGGPKSICLSDREACDYSQIPDMLRKIPFGRRTLVATQCYGFNWARRFLELPASGIMTLSSEDTIGFDFIGGHLWNKDVDDLNNDKQIDFLERFAFSVKDPFANIAFPVFLTSAGYYLKGEPHFDPYVKKVKDNAEFEDSIKALHPGQYAVILVTDDKESFLNVFKKMAKKDRGQHLFLFTTGKELRERFGASDKPKVIIANNKGSYHEVKKPANALNEIKHFRIPLKEKMAVWRQSLDSSNLVIKIRAIEIYGRLALDSGEEEAANAVDVFREKLFGQNQLGARGYFMEEYIKLISSLKFGYAGKEAEKLRKKVTEALRSGNKMVTTMVYQNMEVFEEVFRLLLNDERLTEVREYRKMLIEKPANSNRFILEDIYKHLLDFLNPESVAKEAKELRLKSINQDKGYLEHDLFSLYKYAVTKLKPKDAFVEIEKLLQPNLC